MIRDFVLEEAIENYNPDKKRYFYQSEQKYIDEKRRLHSKLRKNHELSFLGLLDRKFDNENITERRKAILSGEQEKRAIKTFKSFTGDEIENKINLVHMISSNKETENSFFRQQIKNEKGELEKEANGEFSDEVLKEIEENSKTNNVDIEEGKNIYRSRAEKFQKIFKDYEFLGTYRDDKNGLYVYNFGNKKTGKLELFIPGTNTSNKVEKKNNDQSYYKVSDAQKAIVEFAKELDQKSKNGEFFGKNRYDKGIGSINGHSQGAAIAIYGSSFMPDVSCIANEPGPLVRVGPYVKDNAILAVIPNSGEGTFNYAERIEGSQFSTMHSIAGTDTGKGENQTSLITALPVEKSRGRLNPKQAKQFIKKFREGKNFNVHHTHFNHFTIAENAKNAFEKMQKYSEAVEPKLEQFLENNNIKEKLSSKPKIEINMNTKKKKINLQELVSNGKKSEVSENNSKDYSR